MHPAHTAHGATGAPRFPFPHPPTGWFCVGVAADLPSGGLRPLRRFGRDLVLFRTASGQAALLDARCPHLGADLAGGEVVGDHVVCPFHRLGFGADGACRTQPACYPARVPSTVRASAWPLCERDGFLLAWFDAAGRPPSWEPPATPTGEHRRPRTRAWTLRTHPQETGEGSVDLAHLQAVHLYRSAEIREPVRADGPTLCTAYRLVRAAPRGLRGDTFVLDIRVRLHGLGFSTVDVTLPDHGLGHRLWVLATPIDADSIEYRVALAVRADQQPSRANGALRLVPRAVAEAALEATLWREFVHDVELDFPIWERKAYVDPPRLLVGDGPIGPFRRWARQFYDAGDARGERPDNVGAPVVPAPDAAAGAA